MKTLVKLEPGLCQELRIRVLLNHASHRGCWVELPCVTVPLVQGKVVKLSLGLIQPLFHGLELVVGPVVCLVQAGVTVTWRVTCWQSESLVILLLQNVCVLSEQQRLEGDRQQQVRHDSTYMRASGV